MINSKWKVSSKVEKCILITVFLVMNLLINSSLSFAQKGCKALQITGEAIFPSAQKSVGFGLSLKGLYGISEYGDIVVSAGISKFKMNNLDGAGETKVRFIPFLAGYRQKFKKLYIEPKVGIGELGGRILLSGSDYSKPSVTALFGGLEAGFILKRFSLAFDFLATHGVSNSSVGAWYNKSFHYVSVSLAYNLFKKSGL
ncbi:MAG: hypothetical protein IT255_02445 [Chitinophagaceae bacterium]|nr:hypothetical protein [Chitinophagaceae bacterium]